MVLKIKSLRYQITYFFLVTVFSSLVIIVFFVSYNHYSDLKMELKTRLSILSEDILSHKLINEHYSYFAMRRLSDFEPYHHRTILVYFSDPLISITKIKPLAKEGMIQVSSKMHKGDYLTVYSGFKVIREKSYYFALKTLLLFSSLLLVLGVLFLFFLRRLFSPINCLVSYCKDLSADKDTLPICTGSQEINTLKDAILQLVEKNQTLIDKERDIFKEAAHELKSPVAILKTRLALYEQKESFEKAKFINEAKADIDLIVNRLREMLFLKSIEMDIEAPKELLSLSEQCEELSQAFAPIVNKRGLTIKSNREDSFSIYTHKKAIQKVLLAMFENIFTHAKVNSEIEVTIKNSDRSIVVINKICENGDAKLFSSNIGTEIIQRLAPKLDYSYHVQSSEMFFTTTIYFLDEKNKAMDISANI